MTTLTRNLWRHDAIMMQTAYFTVIRDVLRKPLTVQRPPLHIQLEFTTFCNLNCKPCLRSKFGLTTPPHHLTPAQFRQIVEPIRPRKISLSGGGEPLLSPYLFDLIRAAKEMGANINTTTNGTLLNAERCAALVASGLDLLKISIDAATPATYQSIRGEDRFLDVLAGIRTLLETKKRLGSVTPYLRFNYVVSRDNYTEIAATVVLAAELGVDAIFFQPLGLFGIEERQAELVGDMTYAQLEGEIQRALHVSRQYRVETNLRMFRDLLPLYWQKYQLAAKRQARRICLLPWFSAYITLDGDMRPCCTCLQPETTMGNLLTQSLDEVWNGAKYQRFRQAIRAGKRPLPVCETCVPQTFTDVVRYAKILPGFLR